MFKYLLRSRKFWLSVAGVVQTVASTQLDIPTEVWVSINGLIGVLVGSIAVEDAARHKAEAAKYEALTSEQIDELLARGL